MTTFLPIPENLVGKLIQSRIDDTVFILTDGTIQHINELVQTFLQDKDLIEPIIIYENNIIQVKSYHRIQEEEEIRFSCKTYITIQCMCMEVYKLYLKIHSHNDDQQFCDSLGDYIASELFAENVNNGCIPMYLHNFF